MCLLQVWNMNAVNGILGVFNAQGATWSRQQRRFVTHDKHPSNLQTFARPHDVDTFHVQHAATASTDKSTTGDGAAAAGHQFAVYSDRSGALQLLSAQEGVQVGSSGPGGQHMHASTAAMGPHVACRWPHVLCM